MMTRFYAAEELADPIPKDGKNHEGSSTESSSTHKKRDSDNMEDDIENQRRTLSGIDTSTSSYEPTVEKVDGNRKNEHDKDIETIHLSKTDGDIESQSVIETRRYGYLGDLEISIESHPLTDHPTPSPLSVHSPSVRSTTQHKDPSEEGGEVTKPAKKERSSWDFEADDTFNFESGGPLPKPEKPPDPVPIFAPPFVRNKNDFRAKLMHLSELTLPLSPSGQEPDLSSLPANEYEQLLGVSPQDYVGVDPPSITSKKKPPRPLGRSKTRLQDPPPMTPSMSDQLASILSDTSKSSRRGSIVHQLVDDEGHASRFGPTGRRFSASAATTSEVEQMPNLVQSRFSRKSIILNATDSSTIPIPEKPPEKSASRLGMFSPSVMFSASRLGLLSRSKMSMQQAPPPPPEEEADPLDDDSIPRYKKYISKQRRWLVWIQWIGLLILIVIMVLAIKMNKLQMVIWKEIQLWQWLALATVIISGRLIAGWLVMILVAIIERHYILKKRVLYFVYGLRHAVKNVVWLALVIGVWKLVFRHVETKGNIPIVTKDNVKHLNASMKVLWCLFTTACLWMGKILAVKVAANSFHRAAYFDRVQDCLFHQYVLEALSAPHRYEMDQDGDTNVEAHQPTQAEQELEVLLQSDILDPDLSSEAIKPKEESLKPPELSQELVLLPETHRESERVSHIADTFSRSNLTAVLEQELSLETHHIRSGPNRSNLTAVLEQEMSSKTGHTPSGPSRSNLTAGLEQEISPENHHIPSGPSRSNLTMVLEQDISPKSHHILFSASRSNLGSTLEQANGAAETHQEGEKRSHLLASGASRLNLGSNSHDNLAAAHSHSRSNLRMSSRSNLGCPNAQASQHLLSSESRLRRVIGTDGQTSSTLARATSPKQQEKLQELTSETVSAWTMKRLMKMIRKTNIATFSSILDQEAGEKIDSEAQAKAAAKQIFYNIATPGEKFLTLTDFLYFLPEDQATRAFALFEVNDLGHITKKALMKWVVNIYKERRALALTLSDNRTVVAKLHRVLDVLLLAVAITICFLIMGVSTQKLIVGFSSVLLPSVFVFGNAARSTFESLIFLFVMHPFDVGDRICIDGISMIVEEMNILNTILLSGSNEKIYFPNSMLATKAISNYYRSPDQWDSIDFQIHASTPVEQLGLLKERMTKYIESLPQFWYPVFRIICKDIEDSTRMKMSLWVQHHLNYQEAGERWQRRSNMILHLKTQLEDLGIGFHLARQEITVTGIPVLDVPLHHSQPTPM